MGQYVLRRVMAMAPTIIIVSIIVFSLVRFVPGTAAGMMVTEYHYAATVKELEHRMGLDQPIPVQYGKWVGGILHGDFGISIWTHEPVSYELGHRFPVTLELGVFSLLISVLLAIPIGVISAIRQDTILDYLGRSVAILGLAFPAFWVGILVLVLGSIYFRWSPHPWVGFTKDPAGSIAAIIVPALILGFERSAALMRMTRTMLLEVLRQDYVRTAWAKGLRERSVVVRHSLRNALIPVLTILGLQIPAILGASVVIETVFNLPGIGSYTVQVVEQRDYPMVQAIALLFTVCVLVTNLVVDLVYAYLDPRIRLA
jgi:peptide/nickel transport system permease protein